MEGFSDTFSALLSIRAFLIDVLEEEHADIRVFMNPVLLPHEKEEIATLDHYLRIETTEGEINWDQPFDVSFRLWATQDYDPTLLWLQKFPYRLIELCMNTKTDTALNMIALLDFDSLVGKTALQSFYRAGTIPSNLSTVVTKRTPEVPYCTTMGMRIGLKALPSNYAPRLDFETVPMSASWSVTFKYFDPSHIAAVRRSY